MKNFIGIVFERHMQPFWNPANSKMIEDPESTPAYAFDEKYLSGKENIPTMS